MRATLQQEILTGMLTPQLIVLPLAALLAGLGLTQGLEPLSLLQERIRSRRANDMSPISADLAPAEIVPLIAAMNSLLIRLAATSETRSEEHTSELQSLMRNSYAVFCLKKKKTTQKAQHYDTNR